MEKAATKIQSTYRGFKTRKSMKSKPISLKQKVDQEIDQVEQIGDIKVPKSIEVYHILSIFRVDFNVIEVK